MSEQTANNNAAFMEITAQKIQLQDKRIVELEEKVNKLPDNTAAIATLITKMEELQKAVKSGIFSEKRFNELCSRLDDGINTLKMPVQNKILHHHYIPKLAILATGLFVALSLTCAGWYNTNKKLDGYIASDTKYRYLKLNAKLALQNYLYRLDSFYNVNPSMLKSVIAGEDQNRANVEHLQKAETLKAEPSDLKQAVKKEGAHSKPPKKKAIKRSKAKKIDSAHLE